MTSSLADDDVRRLLAAVDDLRPRMIESLQALVRVPSVSPKYPGVEYRDHVGYEGEASGLLSDIYKGAGATVETFAVEGGRDNAIGRLGAKGMVSPSFSTAMSMWCQSATQTIGRFHRSLPRSSTLECMAGHYRPEIWTRGTSVCRGRSAKRGSQPRW